MATIKDVDLFTKFHTRITASLHAYLTREPNGCFMTIIFNGYSVQISGAGVAYQSRLVLNSQLVSG